MQVAHRILNPAIVDPSANKVCALAVMTKAPQAGHVKTRLVPPLTHEEAALLNICFLRDTAASITRACNANARGVGVYTPAGSESAYRDILPQNFELLPQRGNGFGERLSNAVADLFGIGFESVCLIDSDSPTVSTETYAKAVEFLSFKGDRIVVGPSADGGYYLIGLKKLHRQLFEDIDWSTEQVLEQTKARSHELGVELALLPTFYDIDDRATLCRLCDELLGDHAGSINVAPRTREFLGAIIAREGRDRIWPRRVASAAK